MIQRGKLHVARRALCLAAAAGAVALAATPSCAQAPTSLFPNRPPVTASPAPAISSPAVSAPATRALPSGLLGVEDLQAVSGDSFGTLNDAAGFGPDQWKGARRGQLFELMGLMPGATPSLAMNALAKRLLLTSAAVPGGGSDADSDKYLALRLARVAALGDPKAAADLARAAPSRAQGDAVLQVEVDGELLAGDTDAACNDVRNAIGRFGDGIYWRKALAFCQALGNEQAQANLTAAMLREQSPPTAKDGDPAFFALLRAIGGDRAAKVASLPSPAPIHVAMLRAAKLAAPADAYNTNDMTVLAALSQLPEGQLDARLGAAERAESHGALSSAALVDLYQQLRFTQPQLANALTGSESESGPRARALLFAAQAREGAAAARAVLIQRALAQSQDAGLFSTTARVYQDALANIPPTSDLAWFAATATRALFAAGRTREARAWLGALGGGLGGGVGGTAAGADEVPPAVALLPYALVTAEPRSVPLWDPELWKRWKAAQGPLMAARATVLLTILEGLGRPAPDEAWDGLARAEADGADYLPSASVMRTLEVSAATDRKGLTVLAALDTLGPNGPAECHPLVLGMVLAGLRNIGLETEARALAVDAAIGAGL
ncbi:MAG TPA: hypothetical protein VGO34_16270 [Alphaproteobacteria bacterium]|jgi:hypothetical protein